MRLASRPHRSPAPLHLRAVGTCHFSRGASVAACTAYCEPLLRSALPWHGRDSLTAISASLVRSMAGRRRHEAEQAQTAGRGRRRECGCAARREVFRPSASRRSRGWMARLTTDARAVAGGAPPERHTSSALTECAGREMPPPPAEPALREGLHGDGRDPERNPPIAERGADAARRLFATAGEVAAAFSAPRQAPTPTHSTPTLPARGSRKNGRLRWRMGLQKMRRYGILPPI